MDHYVARLEMNSQAGAFTDAVVFEVWQAEPLHAVDDDGVRRLGHIKRDFAPRRVLFDIA